MTQHLKLMAVLAHPDDETLGMGGTLAKYAAEGVKTYLLTATRGERGWPGDPEEYPGLYELGRMRETELYKAAEVLDLHDVRFLDYLDGELDRANSAQVIGKIADYVRRVQPHVVVTFDPYGAYGHPDHIAISQFTTAAVVAAADPHYAVAGRSQHHRVSKLYYLVATGKALSAYQQVFGELVMHINGVERRAVGWEAWAITTEVDTHPYQKQVWQAVACHQSQLQVELTQAGYGEKMGKDLFTAETYYRVFSQVNNGRELEHDLFAGLR